MPPTSEAVLGVAMSSAGMGLILIQGGDGDGLTLYRDTIDVPIHDDGTCCAADTLELSAVLGSALSIPDGTRLRAVLTATRDVAAEASRLLASLADDDRLCEVVTVSPVRAARAWALCTGRAAGYEHVALCTLQRTSITVTMLDGTPGRERVSHSKEQPTTTELMNGLAVALDRNGWHPDCVLLTGSTPQGSPGLLTQCLHDALPVVPVFDPAETHLMLARGAARVAFTARGAATSPIETLDGGQIRSHSPPPPRHRLKALRASRTDSRRPHLWQLRAAFAVAVISITGVLGVNFMATRDSSLASTESPKSPIPVSSSIASPTHPATAHPTSSPDAIAHTMRSSPAATPKIVQSAPAATTAAPSTNPPPPPTSTAPDAPPSTEPIPERPVTPASPDPLPEPSQVPPERTSPPPGTPELATPRQIDLQTPPLPGPPVPDPPSTRTAPAPTWDYLVNGVSGGFHQ